MTKQEFEGWKQETARSQKGWIKDRVTSHNQNCLFMFKGGESGQWVHAHRSGLVEVGTYEDAYPHIGEASFKLTGSVQCKDYADGVTRICNAIGLMGTIEALM